MMQSYDKIARKATPNVLFFTVKRIPKLSVFLCSVRNNL